MPANTAALRGAAFDYFLYGGAIPNTAIVRRRFGTPSTIW
jgi:hypothetical protein